MTGMNYKETRQEDINEDEYLRLPDIAFMFDITLNQVKHLVMKYNDLTRYIVKSGICKAVYKYHREDVLKWGDRHQTAIEMLRLKNSSKQTGIRRLAERIKFRPIRKGVKLPVKKGAAYDLFLPEEVEIKENEFKFIPLGFACKLPQNCYALILARSSTWIKYGLTLTNCVGLIDNAYSGNEDEWKLPVKRDNGAAGKSITIPAGTRLAQFLIVHDDRGYDFEVVDDLGGESRGGFGSTGV